jgi:hypothetical protein
MHDVQSQQQQQQQQHSHPPLVARIASRSGNAFRRQADEYVINKYAVVIQGSARRFVSRRKMAARVTEIAREIKFVLSRRITPHVRYFLHKLHLCNNQRQSPNTVHYRNIERRYVAISSGRQSQQ